MASRKWVEVESPSKRRAISDRSLNLLDLPNEILLHILEFLPIKSICCIKLTCLRFCKLAHYGKIMKKQAFVLENSVEMKMVLNLFVKMDASALNLRFHDDFTNCENDEFTSFLQSNGLKINSITFRSCLKIPQKMVEDIMLFCVRLKELSFDYVEICESQNRGRIKPEQTNTTLKVLVYKPFRYLDNTFTDNFLISLLNFYLAIESFTWNWYTETEDELVKFAMRKIATYSHSLQKLHPLGLNFKDEWEELLRLGIEWPKLSELTLKNWRSTLETLECLLSRCPQLESLSLTEENDPDFFFKLLRVISKYKENLKTLVCSGENFECDREHLDITFPKLETFEFNGWLNSQEITGFPFDLLFRSRNLKYLNLNCPDITDPSIEGIVDIILLLQNNLITLGILLCSGYEEDDCPETKLLNAKFPKLEVLKIRCDSEVKGENLVFVSEILGDYDFPKLKKLELGCIYCIEKEAMEKINKGCPNLEFLQLYCNKLRKNDILESCNNMRNLKRLRIKIDECDELCTKKTEWYESSWQYPENDERFLKLAVVPCDDEISEYDY